MHALAVLSQKGGAGKSTLSIHLGIQAHTQGRRVLFVDLDPQRSLSAWWQLRAADTPQLVETDARRLPGVLEAARADEIDLAVLDTAPAVSSDTATIARLAHLALIPLRPGVLDLMAVASTADTVKKTRTPALLVLNAGPGHRGGRGDVRRAPRPGRLRRRRGRGLDHWPARLQPGPERWRGRQRVRPYQQGGGRDPPPLEEHREEAFMTRKATSLADVTSRKAAQTTATRVAAPTPAATGAVRNVQIRLTPEAFDQLHDLFYEQKRPKQQLLAEALNDLFVKHGKLPLA